MSAGDAPTQEDRLAVGTRVEVRTGFDRSWAKGFTVHEVTPTGYRLLRRSDQVVLPAEIPMHDVRAERRSSMWWI